MPTAEVHRPRCNQDRQSLARDDHAVPRMARTRAATRSTGTSPGTRITTSGPISNVKTDETASGSGGAKHSQPRSALPQSPKAQMQARHRRSPTGPT